MRKVTDIQAIKAELYDLISHVCNGRLTIHPNGHRGPSDRPCSGCSRIMELQYQLRKARSREGPTSASQITSVSSSARLIRAGERLLKRCRKLVGE